MYEGCALSNKAFSSVTKLELMRTVGRDTVSISKHAVRNEQCARTVKLFWLAAQILIYTEGLGVYSGRSTSIRFNSAYFVMYWGNCRLRDWGGGGGGGEDLLQNFCIFITTFYSKSCISETAGRKGIIIFPESSLQHQFKS